jgi:hypothetical protein
VCGQPEGNTTFPVVGHRQPHEAGTPGSEHQNGKLDRISRSLCHSSTSFQIDLSIPHQGGCWLGLQSQVQSMPLNKRAVYVSE